MPSRIVSSSSTMAIRRVIGDVTRCTVAQLARPRVRLSLATMCLRSATVPPAPRPRLLIYSTGQQSGGQMIRHQAMARLLMMGGLIIGLLIPTKWIAVIVDEREARRDE